MRLTNVLHPEIILDRRGDPLLRATYTKMLPNINRHPNGGFSVPTFLTHLDVNIRDHFVLCSKFVKENPQTYYVGKDFAQAMIKLDREIPVDLLPNRWFGYIAFANQAMYDQDEQVDGAYVYIGPAEETPLEPSSYPGRRKMLWISYVCKDLAAGKRDEVAVVQGENGNYAMLGIQSCGRLLVDLTPDKMGEILKTVKTVNVLHTKQGSTTYENPVDSPKTNDVYRALVNVVLYINSIDADVIKTPSRSHLSNKKRRTLSAHGECVNECSIPIQLVSWNYKRPNVYHVDGTWIDTFQRWQRCGPGFSQVKLIWVSPHERTYKKTENQS